MRQSCVNFTFKGPCIVKYMPIIVQQDATIYSSFISVNRSTYFGWYLHPSSGAHVAVSTASGFSKTCRELDWTGTQFPSSKPIIVQQDATTYSLFTSVNHSTLYGCETWSLTLREEKKLRVFENMVLRRIFGPRRDEVTGECRGLHNEELNDLYSSPNIVRVMKSRRMRWVGHVARMGEERGVYRVLVGKPEGKRPLGRPRRRWVDNIRTDLQEVGCGYMDWIGLAQDRDRWRTLVSAVMNLRVP